MKSRVLLIAAMLAIVMAFGPVTARNPVRPEVLIYIANETAPATKDRADVTRIIGWLQSSELASDRELAAEIVEDLEGFPAEVEKAVAAIDGSPDALTGVVIATNRLLQERSVLLRPLGGGRLQRLPFMVQPGRHPLATSNPLSDVANLAELLDLASRHFDPRAFKFVVIVQSHGDRRFVLTPRISRRLDLLDKPAFLNEVHGAVAPLDDRFGVTTAEFGRLLDRKHQELGLDLALLVLQSCDSWLERLPGGVERALIAANDGSIRRNAIDYGQILRHVSTRRSFSDSLIVDLVPKTFASVGP